MLHRQGFTLMEMIVVLLIIGVALGFFLPSFSRPNQQALWTNATNNLLAIYSAEQNFYNNNNNQYCFSTGINSCGSLAAINSSLGLNIHDDGSYTYQCDTTYGAVPNCWASDAAYSIRPITIWLNTGIVAPLSLNNTGAASNNPYSGDCPGPKCPF